MGFLNGKRALIVGLASNRSIAWGVAEAMRREGAELAFSYPNEKMGTRVTKLAAELGSDIILPCDVSAEAEVRQTFDRAMAAWGRLDVLFNNAGQALAAALDEEFEVLCCACWSRAVLTDLCVCVLVAVIVQQ